MPISYLELSYGQVCAGGPPDPGQWRSCRCYFDSTSIVDCLLPPFAPSPSSF